MSRPSSESRLEVESDSPQTLTAKSCLGHLALTSCLFDWLSGWMTEEIPSALRHLNSPPSHMPQSIFSLSEAFSIKMKRGSASSALHCRSPLTDYLQGQKFRTYSAFDKVKSKQDQTAWEHRCVIFRLRLVTQNQETFFFCLQISSWLCVLFLSLFMHIFASLTECYLTALGGLCSHTCTVLYDCLQDCCFAARDRRMSWGTSDSIWWLQSTVDPWTSHFCTVRCWLWHKVWHAAVKWLHKDQHTIIKQALTLSCKMIFVPLFPKT